MNQNKIVKIGFDLLISGIVLILMLFVFGMYFGINFLPSDLEIVWALTGVSLMICGLYILLYFYF